MHNYRVRNTLGEWRVMKRILSTNCKPHWIYLPGKYDTSKRAEEAMDRFKETDYNVHPREGKPRGLPEMKPTDRPKHAKKKCVKCNMEGLIWRENPTGGWWLFDEVLNMFHDCVSDAPSQFDPCPQCGTAFCKCTNVYEKEEEE